MSEGFHCLGVKHGNMPEHTAKQHGIAVHNTTPYDRGVSRAYSSVLL